MYAVFFGEGELVKASPEPVSGFLLGCAVGAVF